MPCLLCWQMRGPDASSDRSVCCVGCLTRIARALRRTPRTQELLALATERYFAGLSA